MTCNSNSIHYTLSTSVEYKYLSRKSHLNLEANAKICNEILKEIQHDSVVCHAIKHLLIILAMHGALMTSY